MGGGDLNTKKSWHPKTLKNQELVWKAEQAAAEEKKRITELQNERAQEHEREKLTAFVQRNASSTSTASTTDRLHWMYDKPDKGAQAEDYLLGKAIGKNFDETVKEESDSTTIPQSKTVNATLKETQVDIARKLREDPLVMVRERERAARAALLNNPINRLRLAQLLRNDQDKRKEKKTKKKLKKKTDEKSSNLDDLLASKLSALGAKGDIDVAALLASDESSEESDKIKKKKKKKRKDDTSRKKKKKSKKRSTCVDKTKESNELKPKLKLTKHMKKYASSDEIANLRTSYDKKRRDNSPELYIKESHYKKISPDRHKKSKNRKLEDSSPKKHDKRKNEEQDSDKASKRFKYDYTNRSISSSKRVDKEKYQDYSHRRKDDSDSSEDARIKESKIRNQITKHSTFRYGCQRQDKSNSEDLYNKDNKKEHEKSESEKKVKRKNDSGSSEDARMKESNTRNQITSDSKRQYKSDSKDRYHKDKKKKRGMSESERKAKLEDMVKAGIEHEASRGARVKAQHEADAVEASRSYIPSTSRTEARTLPTSLESRIQSNRHYIQRDPRKMHENFARRQRN